MKDGDYELNNLREEMLDDYPRPIQVNDVVCYILKKKGIDGTKKIAGGINTLSTKEILEEYQKLIESHPEIIRIPNNTISSYLTLLSQSESSAIYSAGRGHGYYMKSNDDSDLKEEPDGSVTLCPANTQPLEKSLYHLLVSWLQTEGYIYAKDVSSSRKNHTWGNPDILALRITDVFKGTVMEVMTIEAKRTKDGWHHNIFEAVSHTMFANQSYFAYLCTESECNKIDKEMILYAQKFNIGILAIIVPDDLIDKMDNNTSNDITIRIVVPAPYQTPPLSTQQKFLRNLDLTDFEGVNNFFKPEKQDPTSK